MRSERGSRMAVTGRHKAYWYLAAYEVSSPSFSVMSRSANRRAVSSGVMPRLVARSWAMWFHTWKLVSGSLHRKATCVWSGVRTALDRLPRALTSLKLSAYSWLVRAGGGGGPNRLVLGTAKGGINGMWAVVAGLKSGGVGCH